jgi:hypoxanthine phosphoribosyltransferase
MVEKYITLSDLSNTIRKNIWKIPRDIDFIIGVPRSGTICASIISSYLNVPLIDINPFLAGLQPSGGLRLQAFLDSHVRTNRVLVVDDTVSSGRQMNVIKNSLKGYSDLEFIYMCVYLEGWGDNAVDLYLEDIRKYTNNFTELVYYEWNIFQHNPIVMGNSLYDIDGVLCIDPPDERDEEKYLAYIKNATPFLIPRTKIGGIITYRLLKNKEITEKWLYDNGIKYNELIMFDANSWDERNKSGISPELYKGIFYKNSDKYKLFVESNDYQASKIFEIAKKPVLCVESNKLYQ